LRFDPALIEDTAFVFMCLAAILEKVSASIRDGVMFSFSIMYANLAVMVVVLPVPEMTN